MACVALLGIAVVSLTLHATGGFATELSLTLLKDAVDKVATARVLLRAQVVYPRVY